MILWRNYHFLSFNTNPRFPPFLLYARCKSGVIFVRRCFRDEDGNVCVNLIVHINIQLFILSSWPMFEKKNVILDFFKR